MHEEKLIGFHVEAPMTESMSIGWHEEEARGVTVDTRIPA